VEKYGERNVFIAGDGTPDIAEFAIADFGLEIRHNIYQARALIADALDLRYRLPYTWKRVQHATVPARIARRLAVQTRRLSRKHALIIDRRISADLATLSTRRLDTRIEAEIKRIVRETVERQTETANKSRHFRISRPDQYGLCDVWARMPAPDAQACDGSVDRLADILSARKDDLPGGVPARGAESKDEWRSVAAAILINNPVLATRLLLEDQQPDLLPEGSDDPVKDATTKELIKKINPAKLAPTAILHVHISAEAFTREDDQLARIENVGPTLLSTVRSWLGEACKVRLQPIIDSPGMPAVDRYEIPPQMREAVLARTPASVYPWSNSLNRRNDQDHTIPYTSNGPQRQTGLHNLGPLTVPEHRAKTHGRVQVRQPGPGSYVWRSRFGRVIITNPTGTHDLGTDRFAQTVWAAAIASTPGDNNSLLEVIMNAAIALAA
jgi:hypothetical protein